VSIPTRLTRRSGADAAVLPGADRDSQRRVVRVAFLLLALLAAGLGLREAATEDATGAVVGTVGAVEPVGVLPVGTEVVLHVKGSEPGPGKGRGK